MVGSHCSRWHHCYFCLHVFRWSCVNKLSTIKCGIIYLLSSSENDLSISSFHQSNILTEGVPLNLSDQLRRQFLNEWIPFEGGKPPQEPIYSTHYFTLNYCHMSLWLIEACSIGSLEGFELHTLESAATRSAIWSPIHKATYANSLFFLNFWNSLKWICVA